MEKVKGKRNEFVLPFLPISEVAMQAEYLQRREQLISKIGTGTAVFRSAPVAMHNNVEYAFRQDSDFST